MSDAAHQDFGTSRILLMDAQTRLHESLSSQTLSFRASDNRLLPVVKESLSKQLELAVKRATSGKPAEVYLLILASDNAVRRQESRVAAVQVLGLREDHIFQFDFPDGSLPLFKEEIKAVLSHFAHILQPDVVLTHRVDGHDDHAFICKVVQQEFRANRVSIMHFRIRKPRTVTPHGIQTPRFASKPQQRISS